MQSQYSGSITKPSRALSALLLGVVSNSQSSIRGGKGESSSHGANACRRRFAEMRQNTSRLKLEYLNCRRGNVRVQISQHPEQGSKKMTGGAACTGQSISYGDTGVLPKNDFTCFIAMIPRYIEGTLY
jgi:hypothetical protein